MPFFDEKRPIGDLTNIQPDGPEPDPTLLQTFGAAFRTQNTVGSFVTSRGMPDASVIDEDFNPIDYVKNDPKYAPYVEQFAGITNKKYADAKKLQIDSELQDARTLAAAGTTGVIAQMAAGVVDLPSLLPVGGAVIGGGTRAARIASTALGAGLDASLSEGALQATQATRTGEESALNIGGSIVLGGALGLLAGRYLDSASSRAISTKIEGQEAAFAAADREFANMGKGASAGAAARDVGPLTLKDEAFISKLPIVNRQDPLIRLQLNEIDAGREAVRGLAETPLEYLDNAAGVATERGGAVETRMKMWHAPLATALREIDTSFARYYHGAPEPTAFQRFLAPMQSEFDRARGSTERLTYQQFKREVGKAAFSGEQHPIAQVAEAARIYRNLDDAMKKAAIEAKLLPEDVAVKGDVSHLFRMYNKDKIVARRGEFSAVLNDHFISARDAAAKRAESPLAKKAGADGKIDPKAAAQAEQDAEFGRMGERISVLDFTGVDPTGATDSRAGILAADARAAALGKALYFPSGTYLVSAAITPSSYATWIGETRAKTVLKTTSATANLLTVSNGYFTLDRISFGTTVTRTAGSYIDISASVVYISNFDMTGTYQGIFLSAAVSTVEIHHGNISTASTSSIGLRLSGGVAVQFANIIVVWNGVNHPFACLYINNGGDYSFTNCQFLAGVNGCEITPAAGQSVAYCRFTNCWFDTSSGNGLKIDPSSTGVVTGCDFVQCWFSTSSSNGVSIAANGGPTVSNVNFANCFMLANGVAGAVLTGSGITDCNFVNNTVNGSGSSAGFSLNTGVVRIRLEENRMGGLLYGIFSDGTPADAMIYDNSFVSCTNKIAGAFLGNTRIERNAGYNPVGASGITPGASPYTYTAGPSPETVYTSASTSITAATQGGVSILPAALGANVPLCIQLEPNEAAVITYTGTLAARKMVH